MQLNLLPSNSFSREALQALLATEIYSGSTGDQNYCEARLSVQTHKTDTFFLSQIWISQNVSSENR
jgi:hypothetical protein